MREHFVVSSIRSREVAGAQRSSVPHREHALKALDFSNGLLGVHPISISNTSVAIVKRSGICISCLLPATVHFCAADLRQKLAELGTAISFDWGRS